MREVPLSEYVTGTAAADGTCVLSIGPTVRQTWKIRNEAVQNTSTTNAPTAKLYSGPPVAHSYLAGTYDGTNDSASVFLRLMPGGRLTAVWQGCDPGSRCTLSVYGEMVVP